MGEINAQNVKSVEKALKILMLFSEKNRQLTNAEIANRLKLPAPTASRLIKTMVGMGFLTKNVENGRYMLGSNLYYLGQLAVGNRDLEDASKLVLRKLVEETGETAHIWIRDGIYRYCYMQQECTQLIRQVSAIGERSPLWEGATGQVLLGFQRPEVLPSFLVEIKEEDPEVDLDRLLMKAMKAKQNGYAKKNGENENHVGCICAPVFDETGEVNACLGISMPEFRYPEDDSKWVKSVCSGAAEISRNLGYLK